MYITMLMITL